MSAPLHPALRVGGSTLGGLLIAAALLWLMQWLVVREVPQIESPGSGPVIEFVRLKKESETRLKQRELPEEPPPEPDPPPPPPRQQVSVSAPVQLAPDIDLSVPDFALALDGAFLGPVMTGPADRDFIPIARTPPQYPYRAQQRGVEGWVKVSFLITEEGEVRDVVLLDAQPRGVFDQAAMRSVLKWRFKPRIVDGQPVAARAEQVVNFRLDRGR